MPRYEVTAPPGILLLQSRDLEECGKLAALNAKLSGEIIIIVDVDTDKVVGIGLPKNVRVFLNNDT